jgi:hypothetical protein
MAGHYRRHEPSDLEELFRGAGLRIDSLRWWGFPFGRLYDRLGRFVSARQPQPQRLDRLDRDVCQYLCRGLARTIRPGGQSLDLQGSRIIALALPSMDSGGHLR